jgi:hypothetical protein
VRWPLAAALVALGGAARAETPRDWDAFSAHTAWLTSWYALGSLNEQGGPIETESGMQQFTEAVYAPGTSWGVGLGVLWSSDLEEALLGLVGSFQASNLVVRVVDTRLPGRFVPQHTVTAPLDEDEFEVGYLSVHLGYAPELGPKDDKARGALGAAFLRLNAPSVVELKGLGANHDRLPAYAIATDIDYYALGFWIYIDTLRTLMDGRDSGIALFYDEGGTRFGLGLGADMILGPMLVLADGDSQPHVERQLARPFTLREGPHFGGLYRSELSVALAGSFAVGPATVGVQAGVRGAGVLTFFFGDGPSDEVHVDDALTADPAQQMWFLWGPFAQVATQW